MVPRARSAPCTDLLSIDDALLLTTLNDRRKIATKIVSLEVTDLNNGEVIKLPMVYTRPDLPVSLNTIASQQDIEALPHRNDSLLPDVATKKVIILIGQDVQEALMSADVRKGDDNNVYAVKTKQLDSQWTTLQWYKYRSQCTFISSRWQSGHEATEISDV